VHFRASYCSKKVGSCTGFGSTLRSESSNVRAIHSNSVAGPNDRAHYPVSPRGPFSVRITREGAAWLVLCRGHGWLFGSRPEAIAEASEIARGFGVAVSEARADAEFVPLPPDPVRLVQPEE
jgi:hypothetical protein